MTLLTEPDHRTDQEAPARPAISEWLLAMGPVVHGLDYGGRVAAFGCGDPRAVALLATAYPLAGLDVVDPDATAVRAAEDAVRRTGAGHRCELEVGGVEVLPPKTYDLVCFLHGLVDTADPVGAARAALRAVRPTGAVMVVEHARSDGFLDGPLTVGAWLQRAGAARTRLAATTPFGFVLDARPTH